MTSWQTKKDMVRECGSGYGRTRDRQEEMETESYVEEVQFYRKTDHKLIIII